MYGAYLFPKRLEEPLAGVLCGAEQVPEGRQEHTR